MQPQIYTLRWIKLLFMREFHLTDTVVLWDAMFCESVDLNLLDYIAVAMCRYVRDQRTLLSYTSSHCATKFITAVLGRSHHEILARLLRFPPVEDVHVLVEMAVRMKQSGPPPPEPAQRSEGAAGVLEAILAAAVAAAQVVVNTATEVVSAARVPAEYVLLALLPFVLALVPYRVAEGSDVAHLSFVAGRRMSRIDGRGGIGRPRGASMQQQEDSVVPGDWYCAVCQSLFCYRVFIAVFCVLCCWLPTACAAASVDTLTAMQEDVGGPRWVVATLQVRAFTQTFHHFCPPCAMSSFMQMPPKKMAETETGEAFAEALSR